MDIVGYEQITFAQLHSIGGFDYQIEPTIALTDFIGEYMAPGSERKGPDGRPVSGLDTTNFNYTQSTVTFDQYAKGVHLQEVMVYHDQVLGVCGEDYQPYGYGPSPGADGLPEVLWGWYNTDAYYAGLGAAIFSYLRATQSNGTVTGPGYYSMRWGILDDEDGPGPAADFALVGDACVACQGFKFLFKAAPAAEFALQSGPPIVGLRFRVGGSEQSNPRWYCISYVMGQGVYMGYNDSPGVELVDAYGNTVYVPGYDGWNNIDMLKPGSEVSDILSAAFTNAPLVGTTQLVGDTTDTGGPTEHTLDVKFVGGMMEISIDSGVAPFIWTHDVFNADTGEPDWYIDLFEVFGNNLYLMDWSLHPKKFALTGATVSLEQNLGYSPPSGTSDPIFTNAKYIVHCLPNIGQGYSAFDVDQPGFVPKSTSVVATGWDLNGSIYRYILYLFSSPPSTSALYADYTPFVNAVTVMFMGATSPPDSILAYTLGDSDAPPQPQEVSVHQWFDFDTLTIQSSATLRFKNFSGEWTNSNQSGYLDRWGHFGCQIQMGSIGYTPNVTADDATSTSAGLYDMITGIAKTSFTNTWGGGGNDYVDIQIEDFWKILDAHKLLAPRWYDLMNVYYVVAELAELAGISPSQMSFYADYVPTDSPYGQSPILGAHSIYMGVGIGSSQVSRFTHGTSAKEAIIKIAYSLGYCTYFDTAGSLHFEPFLKTVGWTSGSPRVFSFVAGAAPSGPPFNPATAGQSPGASEVWTGEYSSSLNDTKNVVLVIGPNLSGTMFTVNTSLGVDDNSISSDPFPYGSNPSYKGFRDILVWVDNMFVDLNYAKAAQEQMLNFLSIPDTQSEFTIWLDPINGPLFPGNLCYVVYPRSGVSGVLLFVMSVTTIHQKTPGGMSPHQIAKVRIIPSGYTNPPWVG